MSTPKFISSLIELALIPIIKVVEQSEWPATKSRRRLRDVPACSVRRGRRRPKPILLFLII